MSGGASQYYLFLLLRTHVAGKDHVTIRIKPVSGNAAEGCSSSVYDVQDSGGAVKKLAEYIKQHVKSNSLVFVAYEKLDSLGSKLSQLSLVDIIEDDEYLEQILAARPWKPKNMLTYLVDATLSALQSVEQVDSDEEDDRLRRIALERMELEQEKDGLVEYRERLGQEEAQLRSSQLSFTGEKQQWAELGLQVTKEQEALLGLSRDKEALLYEIAGLKLEKKCLEADLEEMSKTVSEKKSKRDRLSRQLTRTEERLRAEYQALLEECSKTLAEKERNAQLVKENALEKARQLELLANVERAQAQLRNTERDLALEKRELKKLEDALEHTKNVLYEEKIDLMFKRNTFEEEIAAHRLSKDVSAASDEESSPGQRAQMLGHQEGYSNLAHSRYFSCDALSSFSYPRGTGRCLVLSYDRDRSANAEDVRRIEGFCSAFDLYLDSGRNLSGAQVSARIRDTKRLFDSPGCPYAYLLVCIMAHGGLDAKGTEVIKATHGSDGEDFLEVKDLIGKIGSCKGLRGKPKIFFIQACRGDEQNAVPYELDNLKPSRYRHDSYWQPAVSDTLIWKATIANHVALRSAQGGSWLIQNGLKEISRRKGQCVFNSIHAVTKKACEEICVIAKEGKISFPVPCVDHSTMRGDFYFGRDES